MQIKTQKRLVILISLAILSGVALITILYQVQFTELQATPSQGGFTDLSTATAVQQIDCAHPPPENVAVDGAAIASVFAWEDMNGNGILDQGEKPLPGVRLVYTEMDEFTDVKGRAVYYAFRPGCYCDCWRDHAVELITPPGYQPTTPLRRDLLHQNQEFQFGFQPIDTYQSP